MIARQHLPLLSLYGSLARAGLPIPGVPARGSTTLARFDWRRLPGPSEVERVIAAGIRGRNLWSFWWDQVARPTI